MKTIERELAKDLVDVISNNGKFEIIEDRYYNYKLWIEQMELSNLQLNNLLKNLVEKIYHDYKSSLK